MRTGLPSKVDRTEFLKLTNSVQVTIGSRCFIYELNDDNPIVVNERDAIDQLANPESFVETGFKLYDVDEKDRLRSVETTEQGNLVFEYREGSINGIFR